MICLQALGGQVSVIRQHVSALFFLVPFSRCFSFDIHNHSRGECWLKRQADPTKPTVGDENRYPAKMRVAKREIWPWHVDEKLWPWEMPEKARNCPGGGGSGRRSMLSSCQDMIDLYPPCVFAAAYTALAHRCTGHRVCSQTRRWRL